MQNDNTKLLKHLSKQVDNLTKVVNKQQEYIDKHKNGNTKGNATTAIIASNIDNIGFWIFMSVAVVAFCFS